MTSAVTLVVDPSVLVQGVLAGDPAGVLAAWRDRRVRLVMSRGALAAHVRALSLLGCPHDLMTRWGIWLSHRPGVVWDDGPVAEDLAVLEFLRLARAHGGDLRSCAPRLYEGLPLEGVRLVEPRL